MKALFVAAIFLTTVTVYSQNRNENHYSGSQIPESNRIESPENETKDKDRTRGGRKHKDGKKKDKRNKDKTYRSEANSQI